MEFYKHFMKNGPFIIQCWKILAIFIINCSLIFGFTNSKFLPTMSPLFLKLTEYNTKNSITFFYYFSSISQLDNLITENLDSEAAIKRRFKKLNFFCFVFFWYEIFLITRSELPDTIAKMSVRRTLISRCIFYNISVSYLK